MRTFSLAILLVLVSAVVAAPLAANVDNANKINEWARAPGTDVDKINRIIVWAPKAEADADNA
ncbi:hypothetical protein PM082_014683 [Marasmius tenuissimus]|nr:hypothetical protein PM082_014683 [Marasmius tenuissimus]